MFDFGDRSREQHDHAIGIAQAVHERERLAARLLEAGRRFVRGLHRSGGVQNDDLEIATGEFAGEIGPREGEDRQGQHQQLENEQPVAAQLLEGGAGLRFGEELLPQQGAGDQLHHPLALEQIKQDDHRNGGGEPKRHGRQ